jgi:hypothetical protein
MKTKFNVKSFCSIFQLTKKQKPLRKNYVQREKKHKGTHSYRAFHRFGQAKFADGGSVLGMSQF